MKRTVFLLFAFYMLAASKTQAYEWKDANGVTWSFNQGDFTINGETQRLWYINGASGYGENVTVPQTVYNGGTACTIEAFSDNPWSSTFFSSGINVTLPSTIKYIGSNTFNFYAGTVKINNSTPPTLGVYGNYSNFGAGVTVLVPAASLNDYHNADVWKDMAVRIISQSATTTYNINATAQASSSGIHQVIGENNLGNVMSLKVTGSINSYDILIMRNKMHNLHYLDLTNANIVANDYKYYDKYSTTNDVLGDYMFVNMTKLITVKLPITITTISVNAFSGCAGLRDVELYNKVKTIGNGAFLGCDNLKNISLKDGLTSIGSEAFKGCSSLMSIAIPEGVKTIENGTFNGCSSLKSASLPSTLEEIKSRSAYPAFGGCAFTSISLPAKLKKIGQSSFGYCSSLTEIRLPSSIQSIDDRAFSGCSSLKDYYAYTVEPTSIAESTFSNWTTATLHIPTLAYNNYYWNTQWSQFAHLVEDNNYQYEYFYLNNDFIFNNANNAVNSTPDVDLNPGSGIIVETTGQTVKLEDVHVASNATASASIIANNNLTVENLYFDLDVVANRWYFVTFPFRVKLTNVTSPGNFVFRYYDGAERATNGKGGWKNVTGSYLNAGQGYIFQTNTAGTLTLKVEKADMDFSGNTKQDVLSTYTAENTANASWNFLGNPHPCYFDINKTGYNAPITVWNGSAYQAVRPGDDQYFMQPFQAFFVQKPNGTSSVNFPANGRYTYHQMQEQTSAARANVGADPVPARSLINLTVSPLDGTATDQTRVVYNAEKATAYEMDCDAAKFFTDGLAAQLYTLDTDGTQYAINERPQGEVNIGYVTTTGGDLTISAVRMDCPVYLSDNELDIIHDMSLGGYTFTTGIGTNESRFTLMTEATITGIQNVSAEPQQTEQVYDLQGRRVNDSHKGAYLVKEANGGTKKVIIR